MRFLIFITTLLITYTLNSCSRDNCQTCSRSISGVSGNFTDEVREVCDNNEAKKLVESSNVDEFWECK